uniref:Uncharacterized protein n=1 Tax=viral metagenome TaxID=1070528 RepID=A0A6C0DXL0_9ZZZZ
MKSNNLKYTILHNFSLLDAVKKSFLLLFIAVFFMSIISLFTKTNSKIIEDFGQRERARNARRAAELQRQIREYQACLFPTAANFMSCGAKYYFPTTHMEAGGGEAINNLNKKMNSSKKADPKMTSKLNSKLNVY